MARRLLRISIITTLFATISACGMPQESYREGKPFQSVEIRGEPKVVAECLQQALVAEGKEDWRLGRDPKTNLYVVTNTLGSGSAYMVVAFDPSAQGKTTVSTRGIAYLFGPIPPWSQQIIDTAKSCEGGK